MFGKEESKRLRQEFWTAFGKSFPQKWILYDTKIKGLALKFNFDVKRALVSLNIEADLEERIALWEKILSLKSILLNNYLPEAIFEDSYYLQNQKEISTIYVEKPGVSIHNKQTWRETMEFFNEKMLALQAFFIEYRHVIDGH